jgi:hypothetical protein
LFFQLSSTSLLLVAWHPVWQLFTCFLFFPVHAVLCSSPSGLQPEGGAYPQLSLLGDIDSCYSFCKSGLRGIQWSEHCGVVVSVMFFAENSSDVAYGVPRYTSHSQLHYRACWGRHWKECSASNCGSRCC